MPCVSCYLTSDKVKTSFIKTGRTLKNIYMDNFGGRPQNDLMEQRMSYCHIRSGETVLIEGGRQHDDKIRPHPPLG
jgi:hypothetical protein